jgi:O-succinylbenzoate synthase
MKITKGEIIRLKLQLVEPFVTSFGEIREREIVLVKLYANKEFGFGEAPTLSLPLYSPETTDSSVSVLAKTFIPIILEKNISRPTDVNEIFRPFKGNEFSKNAVDMAVYDLFGKKLSKKLIDIIGGKKKRVLISNTISIHKNVEGCLNEAEAYIRRGSTYLKLKIKPGYDVLYSQALMKAFPQIKLMLDANSAYTLSSSTEKIFKKLDKLDLYCIEQPLESIDIIDHSKLQKILKTPIALDESIESEYHISKAIELGSCRAVNIKVARVGGITSAIKINNICKENGVKTWVGGMLESPIGFHTNLAISTLDNFSFPIDFLGALSYIKDFEKLFVEKPYQLNGNFLNLKINKPGLGLNLDWKRLERHIAQKILVS